MIYQEGAVTTPDPNHWEAVAPASIKEGDYILEYKIPPVGLRFIPQSVLSGTLKAWVKLKDSKNFVDVKGVFIDTETGFIRVKAHVKPVPAETITIGGKTYPAEVQQSGFPYLAVFAVIGALFGALGLTLILVATYAPKAAADAAKAILNGIKDTVDKAVKSTSLAVAVGTLLALILVIVWVSKK